MASATGKKAATASNSSDGNPVLHFIPHRRAYLHPVIGKSKSQQVQKEKIFKCGACGMIGHMKTNKVGDIYFF
jgi:hypothetical protein